MRETTVLESMIIQVICKCSKSVYLIENGKSLENMV